MFSKYLTDLLIGGKLSINTIEHLTTPATSLLTTESGVVKSRTIAEIVADAAITSVEPGTVQGQMLFWNHASTKWSHTEVSELFWDDTAKRLSLSGNPTADLHAVPRQYVDPLYAIPVNLKGTTGFVNNSAITVSYSSSTRQITLTGDLRYYWRGVLKELTSPWTSSVHSDINGSWYLASSDGVNFVWSQSPWEFESVQVAYAYHQTLSVNSFGLREVHGAEMSAAAHRSAHANIGTYRTESDGGLATAGTYEYGVKTNAAITPGFNQATIHDEDISTVIPALIEGTYTVMYIGAGGASVFNTARAVPFLDGGSYIQVNDTALGSLSDGLNGKYYNVYDIMLPVAADTDSQRYRHIFIVPQRGFVSLQDALDDNVSQIDLGSLGDLSPEFVIASRLTYKGNASATNTGKVTLEDISYIYGNYGSRVTVGGAASTNHALLSNLVWITSGHYGSAYNVPRFDSVGAASESIITALDDKIGIGVATPTGRLTVMSSGADSVVLDIQGVSGQLFSVTDSLEGDIFAVSDISGIPIFKVNSSGAVTVNDLLTSTSDSVVVETAGVLAKRSIQDILLDGIEAGTAQGQMAFWDASLAKWAHTETSEMVWDDVNKRLGIGTSTPTSLLHLSAGNPFLTIQGYNTDYSNAGVQLIADGSINTRGLGVFYFQSLGGVEWFTGQPYSDADSFIIARRSTASPSSLGIPGGASAQNAHALFKVLSSGDVGIGTMSPIEKLQVHGNIYAVSSVLYVDNNQGLRNSISDNGVYTHSTNGITIRGLGSEISRFYVDSSVANIKEGLSNTFFITKYTTITVPAGDGTTNLTSTGIYADQSSVLKVQIAISGDTSTQYGAVYLIRDTSSYFSDPRAFEARLVSRAGSSSNHVTLSVDATTGLISVAHYHPTVSYGIAVRVEHLSVANQSSFSLMGADYGFVRNIDHMYYNEGSVTIGAATNNGHKLQVIGDVYIDTLPYAADTVDDILVSDGGSVKKRTLQSLISDGGYWDRNATSGYVFPATITDFVGIGTISPQEPLHVSYEDTNYGMPMLLENRSTTGNIYNGIRFKQGGVESFGLLTTNSGTVLRGFTDISFAIYTNNTNRFHITGAGNIGVGTTSPTNGRLVVQGSDVGDTGAIAVQNSAGTRTFYIGNNGKVFLDGSQKIITNIGGTGWLELRNNATGNATLQSDTSYKLLLNPNGGNVGIGTTSPIGKLQINGTNTDGFMLVGGAASGTFVTPQYSLSRTKAGIVLGSYYGDSTGASLNVFTFTKDGALFVRGDGNVGINTTSPLHTLDVNGETRIQLINHETTDTDKFLVSNAGVIKYRTGAEVLSDIGVTGNYVLKSGDTMSGDLKLQGTGVSASLYIGDATPNADDGSIYLVENVTGTWGSDMYGFRINHDGLANTLSVSSANLNTVGTIFSMHRDARIVIFQNTPTVGSDVIWHAGNSNKSTVDWVTKELDVYGSYIDMLGSGAAIRSANEFMVLSGGNGAQNARFRGIQVSASYSGTIPVHGILFDTDKTLVNVGSDLQWMGNSLLTSANSGDYIQNQNASAQSANMWISGTGRFDGSLRVASSATNAFVIWPTAAPLGTDVAFQIMDVGANNKASITFAGDMSLDENITLGRNQSQQTTISGNEVIFNRTSASYITSTDAAGYLVFRTGGYNDRLTINSNGTSIFVSSVTASNFISNVATGTQPYATTSTTLNNNLNADMVDGLHASHFQVALNSITDGYVPYQSASTHAYVNSPIYTNGTNVGIGTTDVNEKLTIRSGNIKLYTLQNTSDAYRFIGTEYSYGNGNNKAEIRFAIDGADTKTRLSFHTANGAGTLNEQMRISATGNVGIGTVNPVESLNINNGSKYKLMLQDTVGNGGNNLIRFSNSGVPVYSAYIGSTRVSDSDYGNLVFGTSLSSPTTDSIQERMRITSAGNVGIGTTSPTHKLHLHESSGGLNYIKFTNTDTGTGVSNGSIVGIDASENLVMSTLGATDIILTAYGQQLILKKTTGNVGIGMISPSTKLHILGDITLGVTTNQSVKFHTSTNWYYYLKGLGNDFSISDHDGTDFLRTYYVSGGLTKKASLLNSLHVLASGNVGINTLVPTEKLDVQGNVKVTNAMLSNQSNVDVDTGTEVVATVSQSSYTAVFFDYVIQNGENVRAGTVIVAHNGSDVSFSEASTADMGNTSDVTLSADLSGGLIRLLATVTSDNWSVKTFIRII
jgi:hypothetical protein